MATKSVDLSMTNEFAAAIDFGTCNCSLAYFIDGKTSNLYLSENYTRVPTSLLLKKTTETNSANSEIQGEITVMSIGRIAHQRYHALPTSEYSSYLYFECFKMNLRNEKEISRSMKIPGFQTESFYLIEVISVFLQKLKNIFEKKLEKSKFRFENKLGRKLKATDFTWVITVPAIWQDKGKQIMREAAYYAGLLCDVKPITKLTPVTQPLNEPTDIHKVTDKLILALEPECAGLYCHQLTNDMLADYCTSPSEYIDPKQYMIVDIGGGTVDIAIHDLESTTNTIHSVLPPTGNECGGTKVDEEFSQLLQKIVGDLHFKRLCLTKQKVALNTLIFEKFEDIKQDFGSNFNDFTGYIRLDADFVNFYGEQEIIEGIQKLNDPKILYHDDEDTLKILSSKMEELFAPAVQGIIDCVTSALKKSPICIDTIYLVGGFGGCEYIYKKINNEVSKKYPEIAVIVPADHKIAISRGALFFQQNPDIVFSRVCGAYYGIEISEDWVEEKHDLLRAEHNEKLKRVQCHHVFDTILRKGQTVRFNETFQMSYEPNDFKSDRVTLNVYRTYLDDIKYTKDVRHNPIPNVNKIGILELKTPPFDQDAQRNISVTFYIGRTELQVSALYTPTQEKVTTNLDFLSQLY